MEMKKRYVLLIALGLVTGGNANAKKVEAEGSESNFAANRACIWGSKYYSRGAVVKEQSRSYVCNVEHNVMVFKNEGEKEKALVWMPFKTKEVK